jgi:predicted alpha/beta-fold hydrolase
MKQRLLERHRLMPEVFRIDALPGIRTVYQFDDRVTAPFFGFGTADNYYDTQSAIRFLDRIRVPTLLLASIDDPMVPFDVYSHPSIGQNPCLELAAVRNGGHIGFVSRTGPRFWLDSVVADWIAGMGTKEDATSSLTIK